MHRIIGAVLLGIPLAILLPIGLLGMDTRGIFAGAGFFHLHGSVFLRDHLFRAGGAWPLACLHSAPMSRVAVTDASRGP
jgi:hypothetical protein